MMDDTISRQDAIDAILDLSDFASVIELFEYVEDHDLQGSRSGGIIDAIDAVLLLSSAQPEQKRGKWNFTGYDMFECTCCGTPYSTQQLVGLKNYDTDPNLPMYCPYCGARMDGWSDE